uniref:Fe2OG dioxygenase domain-containing protein n=1 Tax=Craspedostauros australis TaxID=1486917 RepID=A0A7R9WPT9_9STRA
MKNRKHDPNPRDRHGKETKTTWLPPSVVIEDVFPYDIERYDLRRAIIQMLSQCDSNIIGEFQSDRLEDLQVPPSSVWRAVNGGRVEDAQKYLSNAVATNEQFLNAFDSFVQEVVLPYLKQRLVAAGAGDETEPITFYYQRPPTLRLQPGPGWAKVKPHRDSEYGHQNGELNFWVPLTDRSRTGVDLFCEKQNDFHPIPAKIGEGIAFHGSSVRHYVDANGTEQTRVSLDFRIGVQGYFDPYWQMKGTTDDHGRCEVQL